MVITFYSFKGGVGRSMALANIARWLQLNGLDVVIVDWDLEAPGIESFFGGEAAARADDCLGLVDLLAQYRQLHPNLPFGPGGGTLTPQEHRAADLAVLREHLPPIDHALIELSAEGGGHLRLLSAGWRAGDRFPAYANTVQSFDWGAFYAGFHGHAYFDWMRESLVRPGLADVVLVDSRTGVTEMGGVCTRQMADLVVVLAAPNRQNLEGAVRMAHSFRRPEVMAERDERRLDLVMVPSRIDVASTDVKIAFERDFGQQTRTFLPSEFERLKRDFWDLRIPYVAKYAFMEQLAIGEPDGDPDLQAAYRLIAAHLAWLAPAGSRLRSQLRPELDRVFGSSETRILVAPGRMFERAVQSLAEADREKARRILLRMVNLVRVQGESMPRLTPVRVPLDWFDAEHEQVLSRLVELGVLRVTVDATPAAGPAHDEILATPLYLRWVAEDAEFLFWRQELSTYLAGWEADGRERSGLLSGSRLRQAERWLNQRPAADWRLEERAFIQASRDDARSADAAPVAAAPASADPDGCLYVSYRRHDAAREAQHLAALLQQEFGPQRVFVDFEGIRPGVEWQTEISRRLDAASMMLVIIGPTWQRATSSSRDSIDLVELEIAQGLASGMPVLPVLVRGARMPAPDDLPPTLQPLTRRQALEWNLAGPDDPAPRLVGAVRSLLEHSRATRAAEASATPRALWDRLRGIFRS